MRRGCGCLIAASAERRLHYAQTDAGRAGRGSTWKRGGPVTRLPPPLTRSHRHRLPCTRWCRAMPSKPRMPQRLEFVAEPLSRILADQATGFTVIGAVGLQVPATTKVPTVPQRIRIGCPRAYAGHRQVQTAVVHRNAYDRDPRSDSAATHAHAPRPLFACAHSCLAAKTDLTAKVTTAKHRYMLALLKRAGSMRCSRHSTQHTPCNMKPIRNARRH